MEYLSLDNKHILITGAASGIGRECALQASRLGAKVTLLDRNEEGLLETLSMLDISKGQKHYKRCCDLCCTETIGEIVKEIVKAQGAVDGFCHAAGIGSPRPLKMCKPKFTEDMFRIHTFAFIEFVRSLSLKNMYNENASFVGVSSVAAEKGNVSQSVYAAAKGAMNSFLSSAAAELARQHIRINNVAFGMVKTALFDEFVNNGADEDALLRQYLGVIDTQSAANAIIFLLSDVSKFITASVVPVYAGY